MPPPNEPSQTDVLAFLGDPATHGAPVRRIDTHAASVFLAGNRAFKLKRAVRFPFLDFSTREKRRAACEAELVANQPFAPELYRGVVAITRAPDGSLSLGGSGEPVDFAVEMLRFDEACTLDLIADRAGIDGRLADELGRVVAAAHARAPAVAAEPWIAALGDYLAQNTAAFAEDPDLFPAGEANRLAAASTAALARLRPLLAERGRRGLVRRGHGDLHLGNIALIADRPVPFDALEFDPLVAAGDVLYDLAFLLMDLVARGLVAAANIVFNRWLIDSGRLDDLDALAALPLFLSLRAAIRAKVTAARLPGAVAAERAPLAAAARRYFRLAGGLIVPQPAALVAIGGLSGTGKSVLAHALAPDLAPAPGAVVLRSDVLRKTMLGVDELTRLPPQAYSAEATARVYAALAAAARRAVTAGHSVVADAVFALEEERVALSAAAQASGGRFVGLFLTADLATRVERVGHRRHDASDADAAIVQAQETYRVEPHDWTEVDASGTPEETLARARAALRRG